MNFYEKVSVKLEQKCYTYTTWLLRNFLHTLSNSGPQISKNQKLTFSNKSYFRNNIVSWHLIYFVSEIKVFSSWDVVHKKMCLLLKLSVKYNKCTVIL